MIIVWPRLLELLDQLEQPLHDQRREPERQLVDHQQLGFVDQHPGQRDHLLLTARQARRDLLAVVVELGEELEDARDPLLDLAAAPTS